MLTCVAGFASSIWFLAIAFTDSVAWGLGCLLLPFPVGLIFTLREWDKVRVPTLISLVAMLASVLVSMATSA